MAHLSVVPAKRPWLEALATSDEAFTTLTGDPAWGLHLFVDDQRGGALMGNGGWKGVVADKIRAINAVPQED